MAEIASNIANLYLPQKAKGDTLTATELNQIVSKINEIIIYLRSLDDGVQQMISAALVALNNIRVMTSQEYLAQGSWDARIMYVCIDNGILMSVNLGLHTLARREGADTLDKGFAYSLPIIF